jgi:LMBR1 domain-containing protein 1
MDVFILIMTIVATVLLIGLSIYLLAYYCHPDDSGFGAGLFCKIIVVINKNNLRF